ncbi:SDR family oxidoreductase [Leeia sp. TBRC 13508]|uniref:SDR family oxidoreductase n=1 Tax=Leeia speluncae TaxID=2884804 RepID=A0ABS8D4G8_9NEIS|nr:SDR family oxidoreductase [Leeia speluncae]MCB6183083.1 SDR family oxidoreductase [Leeia speluncae]
MSNPTLINANQTSRIVLVTGGSRGLGKATALFLADKGMDVILTYVNSSSAADDVVKAIEAKGQKAASLQLDVEKSQQFKDFSAQVENLLADKWQGQKLYGLINNAGIGIHASFAETTEAQFDQLMNIHLKAPFFLTQTLLPLLADGGRIINLSSGLARFSLPGYAAYATMKGGVEVLTRYMAKEFGARGISVNTIAPGAIETDFGGGAVRDTPALNQFVASQTALGRVGMPDDIGGAMAAILLPESGWINGQRIEASGGMFM